MSKPSLWTTSSLLWLTAYSALILASVTLRADRDGVAVLAFCCVAFCLAVGAIEPREPARRLGQLWPIFAVVGIAGGFELFGWIDLGNDRRSPGLWYAVALAQALAAAILASRREPRDGVVLGVLSFHTIVNVPTATLVVLKLLRRTGLSEDPRPEMTSIVFQAMNIVGVVLLPLFVFLAFLLALKEAHQPAQERHLGWSVHLVGLMATAIMLARWSVRGL